MSVFETILSVVQREHLDPLHVEVKRMRTLTKGILNPNTVGTHFAKHCVEGKIYYERVSEGVYKIKEKFL